MVIDGEHILCHVSKQTAGDTDDIYRPTASIDNKLTEYNASKKTVI